MFFTIRNVRVMSYLVRERERERGRGVREKGVERERERERETGVVGRERQGREINGERRG